ncbi:hypothetical protein LFU01_45680 [Lysinibacillus fusiformis]|nr:hypothetical protein LFU01_45680 [Lysinibacillus fusiformis]
MGGKRGIYSNEAGQGTGAHPAAAEVSHPVKHGIVQAASVYIDTLLICSATAFMILFIGMYNVEDKYVTEGNNAFIYVGDLAKMAYLGMNKLNLQEVLKKVQHIHNMQLKVHFLVLVPLFLQLPYSFLL